MFESSPTFQIADDAPSPRLLKSHLPASCLSKNMWANKSKIIYVARNVKDAIASYQPFLEALNMFRGTKEQFVEAFMDDHLLSTPFWPHVLEFWEMRHEPNIYFTSYERMQKDLRGVLIDLCNFIGKPVPSDEILEKAKEHLSFNSMKSKYPQFLYIYSIKCLSTESSSGKAQQSQIDQIKDMNNNSGSNFQFMRKGVIGSHKDDLTSEQIQRIDSWSEVFLKSAGTTEKEIFGL